MKHLAADAATEAIWQPSAQAMGRLTHRPGLRSTSQYPTRPMRNSYNPSANSLDIRGVRFHYSVIRGQAEIALAFGFVVCHPLNDELPASPSATATACAKARAGDETALEPDPGRLRFRSDERKNNSDERVSVVRMPIDIPATSTGMISMPENIHATYPQSAAVAPILHLMTLATLASRGTTLSTGAAE